MNDEHDTDLHQSTTGRDAGVIIRFLVAAAIAAALVVVGLDNRDDVRVGYGFGHKQAPIWIVLLIAAVAGVIIGWLIKHRPHHR
jgi:uncharacterized integral membrane protein